jgi:hypothetical protein
LAYVPRWVLQTKASIDATVTRLVADGKVSQYSAVPEYQGASFVPISIEITATSPERFSSTMAIWGHALAR